MKRARISRQRRRRRSLSRAETRLLDAIDRVYGFTLQVTHDRERTDRLVEAAALEPLPAGAGVDGATLEQRLLGRIWTQLDAEAGSSEGTPTEADRLLLLLHYVQRLEPDRLAAIVGRRPTHVEARLLAARSRIVTETEAPAALSA